jgi:nicotinamidase-related amidase
MLPNSHLQGSPRKMSVASYSLVVPEDAVCSVSKHWNNVNTQQADAWKFKLHIMYRLKNLEKNMY